MARSAQRWWQAHLAIWIALLLSLTWLGGLGFLLFHSAPCAEPQRLRANGVVDLYLSCRPANEIGDFLSGAFAPLAFLWLVATVFVQATELRLQREELEDSRSVAQETASSLAAQSEQMRLQTQISRDDFEIRRKITNEETYTSQLRSLVTAFEGGGLRDMYFKGPNNVDKIHSFHGNLTGSVFYDVHIIANYIENLNNYRIGDEGTFESNPLANRYALALQAIESDVDGVTKAFRIQIEDADLPRIIKVLKQFPS